MALTTAQLQTLGAELRAETDPDVVAAVQISNATFLTAWCNASSSFIVWRTAVTRDEVSVDGFDWTQVDNLTVGQARIWDWLFDNQSQVVNASEAGKRAGISECWKGTAAKVAVATFVLGKCKRSATWAEEVFATGTGTTVSPGLMTFEGNVSVDDVGQALNASA